MKLEDSVETIRVQIFNACDKRLSQLGLLQNKQYDIAKVPQESQEERGRVDDILNNLIGEMGNYEAAREKLIDELSFTLFNRIAGVKVMEAHQLIPEVFSRRESHGGRSFGHKLWLEQNPESGGLNWKGCGNISGMPLTDYPKMSSSIPLIISTTCCPMSLI